MTDWVVDASVVIKWFIPEVHSESAKSLLTDEYNLSAPELLLPEVGNILWKKHRLGELEATEAREILLDIRRIPLRIAPMSAHIENALAIAVQYQRTVYDSIYLALAVHLGNRFVTADRKLVNALVETQLAENIVWVENIS